MMMMMMMMMVMMVMMMMMMMMVMMMMLMLKVGHQWVGVSFLILPCKKLLANLPPTIPRNLHFTVCWELTDHKRCRRLTSGGCTFAHCDEEIAIWRWMVQNNGMLCISFFAKKNGSRHKT